MDKLDILAADIIVAYHATIKGMTSVVGQRSEAGLVRYIDVNPTICIRVEIGNVNNLSLSAAKNKILIANKNDILSIGDKIQELIIQNIHE